MSRTPSHPPRLVFCDTDGQLLDHPELEAVGVDGSAAAPIPLEDWIPLPEGSDYTLTVHGGVAGAQAVGGELLDTVLKRMAFQGRVVLCGSLSTDNRPPEAFTASDAKLSPSPAPRICSANGPRPR